ncbi:hypothetical protein D3C85_1098640 [compost metagenome]
MRATLMIKALLTLVAFGAIAGCATKKDFYASGGSRADGTVDMAYDFAQFEKPVISQVQAQSIAKSKCRVWGYNDAEAFGGRQQNCHRFDGWGTCIAGQIVHKYQCIGNLNEAPQVQPAATVPGGAAGGMSKAQWQQHQLQQLMNDTSLNYEEHQRRYREIMAQ